MDQRPPARSAKRLRNMAILEQRDRRKGTHNNTSPPCSSRRVEVDPCISLVDGYSSVGRISRLQKRNRKSNEQTVDASPILSVVFCEWLFVVMIGSRFQINKDL